MKLGRIYVIKSKQTDKVYVGSTVETLNRRFSGHKSDKRCTSREILKYGDAEIELLECYECEDDEDLELREAYYIREYKKNNLCVNKKIPRRTKKEWYEDNKETFLEYAKEYREENKEAIVEYHKKRYEKNKEKLNQKFNCECGGKYTHANKSKHLKSKKHQEYLQVKK
jgi:hypothetical protein